MNTQNKNELDQEIILEALNYYKTSTLDRDKIKRIEASIKQVEAKMPEQPKVVSQKHTTTNNERTYHFIEPIEKVNKTMHQNMTFQELAKQQQERQLKRRPHTLNQMRAQALRVRGDFSTNEEALKFVNTLSDEEYMDYINGKTKIPPQSRI